MANPLSLVYNEFWRLLLTETDLTGLIDSGNLVKFNKRNVLKGNLSTGDVPELRVIVTGGDARPRTSSGRGWTETYEIGLLTGSNELADVFFPLRWALIKAVHKVEVGLKNLDLSAYSGAVYSVSTQPVRDGVSEADLARGIAGWMTYWSVDIAMTFATAALA